jgi:hypothetical protein
MYIYTDSQPASVASYSCTRTKKEDSALVARAKIALYPIIMNKLANEEERTDQPFGLGYCLAEIERKQV